MATIILISCVKSKLPVPSRADELYTSALFKKMMAYAESRSPDHIFILSAEHGLLDRSTVIVPYEKTLNRMGKRERDAWYARVLGQLGAKSDLKSDEFVFLAGERYRSGLIPHITNSKVPMKGLAFGEQLAWLKAQTAGRSPNSFLSGQDGVC